MAPDDDIGARPAADVDHHVGMTRLVDFGEVDGDGTGGCADDDATPLTGKPWPRGSSDRDPGASRLTEPGRVHGRLLRRNSRRSRRAQTRGTSPRLNPRAPQHALVCS